MSELSEFFATLPERYKGPDRAISWTIFCSEVNPIQVIELKDHPRPERFLLMTGFENLGWIEVERESKSLYDGELVNEIFIIKMSKELDWKHAIIDVIEKWLEYKNGSPSRPPNIKP